MKYLLQLYKTLHPDDKYATEEDLKDITIKNILVNGIYNDLGFMVGDRFIVLVEAQSTWSMNIIIRALMYLAQTYHDYFEKYDANLYGSKKVGMPIPELYVIYTGDRKDKPEFIRLSQEFFEGKECALEVRLKVLYGGQGMDIISQYVAFTKVYNKQVKLHGRTRQAILETIRICKDQDVLKQYLLRREKEVVSIMMALFDEERIIHTYVESEKREAAKQASEQAARNEAIETATNMLKSGKFSPTEIKMYVPRLSVEEIRKIQEDLLDRS